MMSLSCCEMGDVDQMRLGNGQVVGEDIAPLFSEPIQKDSGARQTIHVNGQREVNYQRLKLYTHHDDHHIINE
jgi:hypothetical protein